MNEKDLIKAVKDFSNKTVLVIGDIMLDKYTFGIVERISPEAPVPVLRKIKEKIVLGGAANVARNSVALGAKTMLAGVVGSDSAGKNLISLLKETNISTKAVCVSSDRLTIQKHRFVTGAFQQMLRVDEESNEDLEEGDEVLLLNKIELLIEECDVIIISDYEKGTITNVVAEKIVNLAKKANKKIVVDTKPRHKDYFNEVDLVTPNIKEAREITGKDEVVEMGESLVKLFSSDILLTKGGDGISIFSKNGDSKHIAPNIIDRAVDPSGAGDTVTVISALGLAVGLSLEEVAILANCAGSLVVQKPGTSFLTTEELISGLQKNDSIASVELVPKVWGYEKWLENNDKYCCKILVLKEGYQCSLHYHKVKDETFLATKGHVRLEVEDEIVHMKPGNFVRLKPNTKHRFTGLEDSEIIEISTHHEDGDSYRIEESRKVK